MLIRYAFNIQGIEVDELFHKLETLVSPERYEKMQRYHFEVDKIRSLFAEILLRYGLKIHFGMEGDVIQFETNEYGKPRLKGCEGIHFNVSHSGDWVICAISSEQVGVDVEQVKEKNLDIAERFYAEEEYQTLLQYEHPSELFYRYWTLKESYVKAEGKGMSIPFTSFAFRIEDTVSDRKSETSSDTNSHKIYDKISLTVNNEICKKYQFQVYNIAEDFQVATCSSEEIEGKFKQITIQDIEATLLV